METHNLRLVLAYEGTRYRGWQRQKTPDTIQGRLEAMLTRLAGVEIQVVGASRTDAGVHARCQVASFHAPASLEPVAVVEAGLRYLPQDIVVLGADVVPDRFHARYLARAKRYVYRVDNRRVPDPFERRTAYHVARPLDVAAMERAARLIRGPHDFASFTTTRSDAKSTLRTLDRLEVLESEGRIGIVLEAPAFLLGMARAIAGTLIEVGQGRIDADSVRGILDRADRRAAGFTAPALGLCLEEVRYDPPYDRLPRSLP